MARYICEYKKLDADLSANGLVEKVTALCKTDLDFQFDVDKEGGAHDVLEPYYLLCDASGILSADDHKKIVGLLMDTESPLAMCIQKYNKATSYKVELELFKDALDAVNGKQ